MKLKLDRIISIATLAALLVAIVLLLKKPAPVAQPPQAAANAQSSNAQSLSQKADQLEPAAPQVQQTQQSQTGGGHSAASQPVQNSQAPQSSKAEAHILYESLDKIAAERFAGFLFEPLMASELDARAAFRLGTT